MGKGGGSPFALKGLIVLVFVLGAMLGGTSTASAMQSPLAAYSFDEGEGEVAADAFGEHDGTVKGAEWTKGKYGSALKFNGSEEECVRIADSPDLRLSEEFTIEAWVKPEGGDTSDPIIFKETGGNFTYALAAGLFHASTPEGAVAYEPNVSTETESPTDLTQNVWNHLALTYDGAYLRLYLDGELVDTEKSAPAIQTKDPLAIGCSYSWEEGMTGKIDEVRIYDRALDEREVADLRAPSFNGGFFAEASSDEGETTIFFAKAIDTGSQSGATTIEAPYYTYRYAIDGGSFTAWKTTTVNVFTISTPSEDETISLEIYASDAAGNRSETKIWSATLEPEAEAPPLSEEQIEEAEEADQGPNNPTVTRYREGESSEEFSLMAALPFECQTVADYPHISTHKKPAKFINAISWVECGPPGGWGGWVTVTLMRIGPYGAFRVNKSGRASIGGIPFKKYRAITDPAFPCEPGKYYALATSSVIPPPGVEPIGPRGLVYNTSPTRRISKADCK
jgi:concanavalin A-like lectin/glucanase superfamily protein